jgi:tRNA threonylcarbamoyladenosine biosynthesis protein TsaE
VTVRHVECAVEADTQRLGAALAAALDGPAVIHLRGDLGAGKSTLARALVQALVPGTRVKSPTYTLVESYATPKGAIHHLDLYRVADPSELEALGVRDLGGVVLIEWPERGGWAAPRPDLTIALAYAGEGREAAVTAGTPAGERLLVELVPGDS